MRHSRAKAFDDALGSAGRVCPARHWSEVADDPIDPRALGYRSEQLRAAWRPDVADRVEFLIDRCRSKRVLDIGCVAHDVARMASPQWLHAKIAGAASRCVGVDIHHAGIAEMLRLGYEAIAHDLTTGLGPVSDLGPFDVIVAGELIEHVGSMDMLFETAAGLLADDGELIVTTPNPWAPHRVRAAQLGHVWDNADHILFAFPGGMAELADRHDLVLTEAATTVVNPKIGSMTDGLKAVRRRWRGRQWMTVGFASLGDRRVARVSYTRGGRMLHGMWWPRRQFLGETFIYVVRRPPTPLALP